MSKQPKIKKFKAPCNLDDKPVFILAETLAEAKNIFSKELIKRGDTCVDTAIFDLQEVVYIMKG